MEENIFLFLDSSLYGFRVAGYSDLAEGNVGVSGVGFCVSALIIFTVVCLRFLSGNKRRHRCQTDDCEEFKKFFHVN